MLWKIKFGSANNEYRGTIVIEADTFNEAVDKFDRISLGALDVESVNKTGEDNG